LKNLRDFPYKMLLSCSVKEAVEDLKKGKILILTDDKGRENEGDLFCAAEKATPAIINFMIKYGRGLVCAPITKKIADRLKIPLMVNYDKEDMIKCKFTVSVDALKNVTTGISAYERAITIRTLADPKAKSSDFCKPGHVFPIVVNKNGTLSRPGHSEAAVDLCRLANMQPVGVICEIIKDNGKMARINDLLKFSKQHKIKILAISQLKDYLRQN